MTVIPVAVAGAAGRMGQTVCAAVEDAPDMEVVARADPALGVSLEEALSHGPAVLVDFTTPDTVLANAHLAVQDGVHVVIGTTGYDPSELQALAEAGASKGANVFVAPNFAIGAVLMMRFAEEAARHMSRAEIIELHHDQKLDAPSGTAKLTAARLHEAAGTEREVPIHSVRLPGLVAHQEVIFGEVGQTLTIRHDSVDRASFMPGVLLAIRRVGELTESPVVGLEKLLF